MELFNCQTPVQEKEFPSYRKGVLLLKHALAFPHIMSKIDFTKIYFTEINFTEIDLTEIDLTKIILTISISIKQKSMFYCFLLSEKKVRRYYAGYFQRQKL